MRCKRWGELQNGCRTSSIHTCSDMSLNFAKPGYTAVCDHKYLKGLVALRQGDVLWSGWNASCSSAEVWR